MDILLLF